MEAKWCEIGELIAFGEVSVTEVMLASQAGHPPPYALVAGRILIDRTRLYDWRGLIDALGILTPVQSLAANKSISQNMSA